MSGHLLWYVGGCNELIVDAHEVWRRRVTLLSASRCVFYW